MVPPILVRQLDAERAVTKTMPSLPASHPASRSMHAAVVLVAHGSAHSGASSEPVRAMGRALAARGFTEVGTGFWKEEPFLHQALDTVRCPRVVVVPLFLAQGYFSRVVVPRELGLRYGLTTTASRQIRLLSPIGADPELDGLVLDRARSALPEGSAHDEALVVVLGHGTRLDPGSADTVLQVCRRLERRSEFARVAPAFIDQEPQLAEVADRAAEPLVVVVPFLVAAGFHGGGTVPEELADTGREGRHVRAGVLRKIVYTEPIGTHPALIDTVVRKILDARFDTEPVEAGAPHGTHVAFTALEAALADQVSRLGSVIFLEVEIRAQGDAYLLRHGADGGAADGVLVVQPDTGALEELARRTSGGSHRPLRTAAGLPTGWRYRASGIRELVNALIALYGPAVVHWHLGDQGRLRSTGFAEVAARQTGVYAALQRVEPTAVSDAIRHCCEGHPCLRSRVWDWSSSSAVRAPQAAATAPSARAGLAVPCPAPCPILLSTLIQANPDDPVEAQH